MKVDVLVAEIGSTTTMVNAFGGVSGDDSAVQGAAPAAGNPGGGDLNSKDEEEASRKAPRYLGQGIAPTSVEQGDVRIGLDAAVADLARKLSKSGAADALSWNRFYA